jgi:acyl carrier protein
MPLDRQSLVVFLEDEMSIDLAGLSDDEALFSSGLLDSFGMVELMSYIEVNAGIRFDPDDVSFQNLDSINRILAFVERATGASI